MRSRHMSYAHSEDASSIRLALGAILRRRRQEAERSLTELAEAAELSPAYLSEVERGLKDVSMERLLAIAKALEIQVADLYLDLARSLSIIGIIDVAQNCEQPSPEAGSRLEFL